MRAAIPSLTDRPFGRGSKSANPATASPAARAICPPASCVGVREEKFIPGSCRISQAGRGMVYEVSARRQRRNRRTGPPPDSVVLGQEDHFVCVVFLVLLALLVWSER